MKIVLAPQEFKGSLTAREAVEAMASGVRRALPDAAIEAVPMADGGPGLVDALLSARGGELRTTQVRDPLGRSIQAAFGLLDGRRTAVIEMAAASGLCLLSRTELDPLHASSYGTGELIRAALDAGARELVIGIGGSATSDGGAGMAQALGARLLDADGEELPLGGAALAGLERIEAGGLDPRLGDAHVVAACDVRNPLCGPEGAAAVYGPQKGASPAMVEALDSALARFAAVIARDRGVQVRDLPGAGAAGGLGAGLVAFLAAELRPGFAVVAEAARLAERLLGASLVLTGEGRLDAQSAFGKTTAGVAGLAAKCGIPAIAIAGGLGPGYELLLRHGLTAAFSLVPAPMALEESEAHAFSYLAASAESVLRTFLAGSSRSPLQVAL